MSHITSAARSIRKALEEDDPGVMTERIDAWRTWAQKHPGRNSDSFLTSNFWGLAVDLGAVRCLRRMFQDGAIADPTEVLRGALRVADGLKRYAVLIELLNLGVDPNAWRGPKTVLAMAIGQGDERAVELLLRAGADPNAVGTEAPFAGGGRPHPLVRALQMKNVKMIQSLLDHGADPRRPCGWLENGEENTVIAWAERNAPLRSTQDGIKTLTLLREGATQLEASELDAVTGAADQAHRPSARL